ncbi:MAG: hypothetical protein AB7L66_08040 [Gemmatimonadales bacterium]
MKVLLWGIGAVVAGLGVTALGIWSLRARQPQLREALPATPMQRLSRRGLAVGALLTLGLLAVVGYFGPERTMEDDAIRIGFTLLLLAILAVFALLSLRLMAWIRRRDTVVDERDRAILSGSHGLRSGAMLVTLAIWMIGLVESYQAQGSMPLYWLYFMFWSVLVVSLLTFPLGILFGYRSA